ncbi:hypothetical protein B0H11DRAFT_75731 [Mycena galericulata]|nr:hypothetical protein B0H11DRAFT_75731 [Mycena galericulata]
MDWPHEGRPRDWMKSRSFWVFLADNTGFAYFLPIVYLPTFANDLRVSPCNSAVTLAMLNGALFQSFIEGFDLQREAASVPGRLVMGYLPDKVNPCILAFSTLLAKSVTTFVL